MRRALATVALTSTLTAQASAQPPNPPPPPSYVQASDVASMVAAAAPQPASAAPSSEAVGGSAGTSAAYARADHTHPRITRAATFLVGANGVLTGTWSTPAPAAPNMIYTATAAATSRITCQNTSTPTSTGFAAVCWQDTQMTLNGTTIAGGVSVGPGYAPAGTPIQATAVPPSQ